MLVQMCCPLKYEWQLNDDRCVSEDLIYTQKSLDSLAAIETSKLNVAFDMNPNICTNVEKFVSNEAAD